MDFVSILIVFGFLAFFGFLVFMAVRTGRDDREGKLRLAQTLGFTPIEPDNKLKIKISRLYENGTRGKSFQLKNVSRKQLPDGEMYFFDLIETSGDDNSITEQQAVAITSPNLNLPDFVLYPKVDADKYMLGGLANNLIHWATTFIGKPVDFPEYPEFQKKYVVSSSDPELVRRYFNRPLADGLAQTSLYNVYAGGDTFCFSQLNVKFKKLDQNMLTERMYEALGLAVMFQKNSPYSEMNKSTL